MSERSSSGACACSHGAEAASVPGPQVAQDAVAQRCGSAGGGAAEQALPAGDERDGESLRQGSEGKRHCEEVPAAQPEPPTARCSQERAGERGRCQRGSEHAGAAPVAAPAHGAAAVDTLAGSWAAPGWAEARPLPVTGEPAAAAARLTERLPRPGGGREEGGGAPGAGAHEQASASARLWSPARAARPRAEPEPEPELDASLLSLVAEVEALQAAAGAPRASAGPAPRRPRPAPAPRARPRSPPARALVGPLCRRWATGGDDWLVRLRSIYAGA